MEMAIGFSGRAVRDIMMVLAWPVPPVRSTMGEFGISAAACSSAGPTDSYFYRDNRMNRYIVLVLFGVALGGCTLLAPKDGGQEISVLPDDPTQDRTVIGSGEPLPPGAIVLPADEDADVAVAVEKELPEADVIEITELKPDTPASAQGEDIYLPEEVAASADAEAVIIPAEDSSGASGAGLSADAIRVEILNASGIPGLEQQVSERLAGKGYFISWAGESAASGAQQETRIKYRPNYAREAVRLGHVLPGNQIVTRGDDLPEGVDIRIIVGSDQQ